MQTKKISLTIFLATLLFMSSYFTLPIGTVPITTQTFFVIIIGLLLPYKYAFLATLTNLILQAIFQAAFLKATFGFIIGFIVAAVLLSYLSKRKNAITYQVISVILSSLCVYLVGVPYFMLFFPHKTLIDVLMITMIPFLIGDTIKAIFALGIAKRLQNLLN